MKKLILIYLILTVCYKTSYSYDWKDTSELNEARSYTRVIGLNNGDILVMGGYQSSPGQAFGAFLKECEVYNYRNDEWIDNKTYPNIDMPEPRYEGEVVLLNSGSKNDPVLYIGGSGPNYQPSKKVFKFDPFTMSWTEVASMTKARTDFASCLLADGRVLVAGGQTNQPERTAEIYDPVLNKWTRVSSMNDGRADEPQLISVFGGKAIITGGNEQGLNGKGGLYTAEIYDPITDTWSYTENDMEDARQDHVAFAIPEANGVIKKIMVVGGLIWEEVEGSDDYERILVQSSEICEYHEGKWTWGTYRVLPQNRGRWLPGAVILPDKNIILFGGHIEDGPTDWIDLYDTNSNQWSIVKPGMNHKRSGYANNNGAELPNGSPLFVAGGYSEDIQKTAEYLNITSYVKNKNTLIPDDYVLFQNYPNPFNPFTRIKYRVKEPCQVYLVVYNLHGQVVKKLVNSFQQPGDYIINLDMPNLDEPEPKRFLSMNFSV